jgi:hypothetical protein
MDKLVDSEKEEPNMTMDAIHLTIFLALFLATIGLVLGIDRIGEDR